jgi:RNA polymerase sigma factor (sigma-70 family)
MSYLRSRPDLLTRFRSGDRDALAEVYHAYLSCVRSVLQRGFVLKASQSRVPGLTTHDDLADAIQEVFTRAFKREARLAYDGTRDYAPYLSVVARNVVVTRHRKQARETVSADPLALSDADVLELDDAESNPPWLDSRALEVARHYVSSLDEPLRAVHAARYIGALSQRDAARELGMSRPKVRKLEDRIRHGLLRLLVQAGVFVDSPDAAPAAAVEEGEPWTSKPRPG